MAEILKDTTANTIGTGSGGLKLDPAGTDIVTIGNGVMLPDGTKTEPAIRFTDDNNTGIYSPVNDQVAITGHGEDVLVITGVASSVNAVEVKASATGNAVEINAVGSDANVSVNVTPKGTGTLKVAGTDVSLSTHNHDAAYAAIGHNHGGVYEPADATILKDADISVSVAAQSHNHTGTYEPANANIQAHVSSTSNPHGVTAAQVGAYTSGAVDTLLTGKSDTSHSHTLDGLSDVAITTPASGHIISYNGSSWVNGAPAAGGGADPRIATYPTTPTEAPLVSTGTGQLAIGDGAVAGSANAYGHNVAIGKARCNNNGSGATTINTQENTLGAASNAGWGCISIGYQAQGGSNYGVAIGYQSVAGGTWSVVVGREATCSGSSSVVLGYKAKGPNDYSTAVGSVTRAGWHSTSVGYAAGYGEYDTVSNYWTTSIGDSSRVDSHGEIALSTGYMSTAGDVKSSRFILRTLTADATPKNLGAAGTGTSPSYYMGLTDNSTYVVRMDVVARAGNTDYSAWTIICLITRGAGAATTALVGSVTKTLIGQSAGASAWDINITADTTNGRPAVTATGAAATSIRWVATTTLTGVKG